MGEIRIRFLIIFPVKAALDLWVRGEGLLGEAHKCFGAWHPWSWGRRPRFEFLAQPSPQHTREAEKERACLCQGVLDFYKELATCRLRS